MGRPNKTEEKRTQILDAFEKIILIEGYAKASQRKIAQEAKVNQPMIHHYFSGSEELLDALLNRVAERYQTALTLAFSDQESVTLEQFMGFVCSEKFHKISQQNEVFFALIGQGGHKDTVFKKMIDVYQFFLQTITQLLLDSNIANPEQTAYMSMCFIIGHDWAKKLGFGEERNQEMADYLSEI